MAPVTDHKTPSAPPANDPKTPATAATAKRDAELAALRKIWVPDNFSNDCMDCKVPFGFFKRRYHCRVCGLLFCSACVRHKMTIPVSFGYTTAERCCRSCVVALQLKTITSPADVFAQRRGGHKKSSADKESNYEILSNSTDTTDDEITRQHNAIARRMETSTQDGQNQLEKTTDA